MRVIYLLALNMYDWYHETTSVFVDFYIMVFVLRHGFP